MCVESKLRYNRVMLWSKQDGGENTLIVDVSSGSTGAALLHTTKTGLPEIVTRTRTPFLLKSEPTKEVLESAMITSLETSLGYIAGETKQLEAKHYGRSIDKAVVTLSTPWIESFIRTAKESDDKGFVFSEKNLKEIMKLEKEEFQAKLKSEPGNNKEIFESAVMNLYLNGYATPSPIKERVTEADASLILSAADKKLLWKIENTLIKSVGLKRGVALHSFLFVFYKVLSHSFQNLHTALLVNMTLEMTDTLFLRHAGEPVSATLPFGPAVMAREVGDKLGIPLEITYSYLKLFADGNLDQTTTETLDRIITEKEEVWKEMWSDIVDNIVKSADVPYSIFLIVPSGFGRLIRTFFENIFPNRNIILVGDTNNFTKELVSGGSEELQDEKILVISSFSNLLK